MDYLKREFVRQLVFDEIRSLTGRKDMVVHEDDPLVMDATLYGNDFGNVFIIEIEGRLKVRASTRGWSDVYTVGDAINLLTKSIEEKT